MLDTNSWSSLICLSLAFCSSWVICIRCSNLSVSAELLVDSSFAFSNSFSEFSRAFCISANLLSGDPPLFIKEKRSRNDVHYIGYLWLKIVHEVDSKRLNNTKLWRRYTQWLLLIFGHLDVWEIVVLYICFWINWNYSNFVYLMHTIFCMKI